MPECAPITIAPQPGGSDNQAVYATFILKNTADARVTQAGCITSTGDHPSAYCYFEISATVPEPAVSMALIVGVAAIAAVGGRRRQNGRA